MTQEYNIEPYYDDYDKHSHFYQILFRSGYSVQTRELTQLQTILQEQIRRMGNHVFKNGTMVIPGELSLDMKLNYVKLQSSYNSIAVATYIDNIVGKVVVGGTSGITAQIISVSASTTTDPDTIFVKYLDGGTSGAETAFNDNETITPVDIALAAYVVQSAVATSTGTASSASIEEGVYYIDGYFVHCEPQLLILDKYSNVPTYSIGFDVLETVTTPEDNETLLDNAQGSYNFAAPGAHRREIDLVLTKKVDIVDPTNTTKYIQLVSTVDGVAQSVYNQTQYAEIEKVMARRTYDESGDYAVRDFKYSVREHRNNDRGAWVTLTAYLQGDIVTNGGLIYYATSAGTSGATSSGWAVDGITESSDGGVSWRQTINPQYNRGVYSVAQGGNEASIALGIESGKAYVKGYEIEKVATSYKELPKARDSARKENGSLSALVGNYVLVSAANIFGLPNFTDMLSVTLYDRLTVTPGSAAGAIVGTAMIRQAELHSGTVASGTEIYKISLFNIVMESGKSFARDVKQLLASGFSADVEPQLVAMAGTITTGGSGGLTGTDVTGTGTVLTNLRVGDYIFANGEMRRVVTAPTNSSATIDAAFTDLITVGASFWTVNTKIFEPQNSNLVFPIHTYLKSARGSTGLNETIYSTIQLFTGTTDGSGFLAMNLPVVGGDDSTFASSTVSGNYIGIIDSTKEIIYLRDLVALTAADKTATADFSAGSHFTVAVTVLAVVNKAGTNLTEKTKTVTGAALAITTKSVGISNTIQLNKADVRKIITVKMKDGTWAVPSGTYSRDITNRFTFSTGQNDSFYGVGTLILKEGQKTPEAPFEIEFEYFAHSSSGDYFTINSYGIAYGELPWFGDTCLGDSIDFRPRIDDLGINFTGVGSSTAYLPKRGTNVNLAYDFYLSRIDKLMLESSGDFHVIEGTSSESPSEPQSSSTGMLLGKVQLLPYTINSKEVSVKKQDNRRYTMRDIGKLEKRINNLEYYTALSLVEQNTSSMDILDEFGLDRFKNGFIVDGFKGHGIGDIASPDYFCSTDSLFGELRPYSNIKNVTLYEANSTNRVANNYQVTGDLVTLPYTDAVSLKQPMASQSVNVNPFASFSFIGAVTLNPESDNWFESEQMPDLVVNVEGDYNSQLNALTSAGILGTAWDSWEIVWTGVPTLTGVSTNISQSGGVETIGARSGGNYRVDTTATLQTSTTTSIYATESGLTRNGITTTIEPSINMEVVGDSLISSTIIPFMRSRNVAFISRGLKGNSNVDATFDSADVNLQVTPAVKMVLDGTDIYDTNSNAGSDFEVAARQIGDSLDLALNKGMILRETPSNATCVILYQEPIVTGAVTTNVWVVNVKGTFTAGQTIEATLDGGVTGIISTTVNVPPATEAKGAQLKTDYTGTVAGILDIPNSDTLKFRTGVREFKLSNASTSAASSYSAVGILDTYQTNIIATRNANVVRSNVNENTTVPSVSSSTASSTQQVAAASSVWYDPLAQTILVDSVGGMFATKLDIFFSKKETVSNTPIRVELREVINGFPGNKVLPFSTVYAYPADITTSLTGQIATTFTFPSLVYLKDATEYAIVLISDSNNYEVMISQLGQTDIVTNQMISTQPYLGVLFKSSNASTWDADQNQDLKFTLHRALFNTSVVGSVVLSNGPTNIKTLQADPIHTTAASTTVRVFEDNHNMNVGSTVDILGALDTGGIVAANINGSRVLVTVDADSYTFVAGAAATSTGIGGGAAVTASQDALFDSMYVDIAEVVLQDTTISYSVKSTSGKSVDGTQTPYVKDATWSAFQANNSVHFGAPRTVGSRTNETLSALGGATSLDIQALLTSTLDTISPVIDIQRVSATLINNKLNNPTLANININAIDDRNLVSVASKVGFDATLNSIWVAKVPDVEYLEFITASIGKYVNVSGATLGANNGDFLIVDLLDDGTNYHLIVSGATALADSAGVDTAVVTVDIHEHFVDEIAPLFGSVLNKYISKEVVLANPSTFLKVACALNVPNSSDVDFYYRVNQIGGAVPLSTIPWTPMTATGLVKSDDFVLRDIEIDLNDIASFDSFQVKIVMRGANSAEIPRVRDLRIIACA